MKKLSILVLAMLFVFGMATAAFAANYDAEVTDVSVYSATELGSDLAADDSANDNDVPNANGTGIGVGGQGVDTSVIKSQGMIDNNGVAGTQRTHGEYQNNTNSCASCHQTHTGAAKSLLFKSSVYTTCTACHDGTLGFYNVFSGSTAGTFGGTAMGNASVHLATGINTIKAAPGGDQDSANATGRLWGDTFTCASCHAPHGSYSDRLLHYNPNNISLATTLDPAEYTDDDDQVISDPGGKKKVNIAVYADTAVPDAALATPGQYIMIKGLGADVAGVANLFGFANSKASDAGHAADTVAVMVYEKSDKWYVDTTPWLYGYRYGSPKNYWSALKTGNTGAKAEDIQPNDTSMHYMYGDGYAYGTDVAGALYVDVAPAFVTKLVFDAGAQTDFGGVPIKVVDAEGYDDTGYGVKISAFCAACHVDYMNKSGSETGTYDTAYRHSTTSDSYVCLKCHFAHGTDVTVMADAKDDTVATLTAPGAAYDGDADGAKAYLLDNNASSALKRYTNMSVCWKCHTDSKATQLKNNSFFWENYDTVPHGF